MANRFVEVATAVEAALNAHTWVADTPDQVVRKYRPDIRRLEKKLSVFVTPAAASVERLDRGGRTRNTIDIDVMVIKPLDGDYTTTQIDTLLTFVEEVAETVENGDVSPNGWLNSEVDVVDDDQLDAGLFVSVATHSFLLLD